jgi:hypothetical protein
VSPNAGKYVVLQKTAGGDWRVVVEVNRRPGLPARRSRRQAVHDALGRDPRNDEVFTALLRSEWNLGLELLTDSGVTALACPSVRE